MGGGRSVIIRRSRRDQSAHLPDDLHPVLRRVYAARGLLRADQLQRGLDRLLPASQLMGMEAAVDLLGTALMERRRILVIGDFDADGATSTALAVRVLRACGAAHVEYLVPDRFRYGYGLTPGIVRVAVDRAPDLIVTVDNGISSIDGVRAAKEAGIRVLVTDHHLPGQRLPDADAIVNPNQPGDEFASKNLAGVGVMFYLLAGLRARLRQEGWFTRQGLKEPILADYLDLVALGTVADVVPLDHNNRVLVEQGLRRIRAGRACPGIQALLEVAGRNPRRAVASDLGFFAGPRINAAGRLEDMSIGIECLLADDPGRARELAAQLNDLNLERRAIEDRMREEALAEVERLHLEDGAGLPVGLCLYDGDWHQGVVGLVASRVKDRVHRPVIAFAPGENGELKGSARSVPGLHIRDALDEIATTHPGLIDRFGGHAMAAGLSLQPERLEDFRVAFDAQVRRHLGADDLRGMVWSDGELAPSELNLELAEALRYGGPWGQGFPEPVFDGRFRVERRRVVGDRHLKMTVRPEQGDIALDAIAFGFPLERMPDEGSRMHLAYRLDVNEYRGLRGLQLLVEWLQEE